MRRNKNKYILFSLLGILLLMIVGFAAFSQRLEVSETSEVTTNWNITITDIKTVGGTATNKTEPSYERLTASFDINFENISDYIEYEVTVSNLGDVVANLNDITVNNGNDEVVSMTYEGIEIGEKLGINEDKTFKVKLLYKGGSGEGSSEITINYGQDENPSTPIVPAVNVKVVYDYETNGGTGEIKEKYFNEGENVELNINGKKEGYTFVGWNTNKDAKEALTSYSMPNEDTTLYAIYKKEIKVLYKLSEGIYKIGKENDSCFIYNNEESCKITLPEIEIKEGYVLDGWYSEENKYEGEVTLNEDTTYEARVYDNTPATLNITTSKTSKSITVVANTISNAPIEKYEYSINGGDYIEVESNTYTFNELNHDTVYNIKVKVTTKANKETESEIIEIRTNKIETPTFSEDVEGEVLITYPEGCDEAYTCTYIKDSEEEVIVTENTTVIFGASGTLIAKVTDGKNYITSSTYTVERTNLYVASAGNDTTGYGTLNKPYATITKAYSSAAPTSTIYIMNNITSTKTTTFNDNKNITLTSYNQNNSVIRGNSLIDSVLNVTNGTLNINNITIDGNNVRAEDALIIVQDKATIGEGTVVKNANNVNDYGGAFFVAGGKLTMNKGTISNNKTSAGGAAVFINTIGTFVMNGGTITNNNSLDSNIWNGGKMTINGGNITNNVAHYAAGVGVYDGVLTVNGGTIIDNTSTDEFASVVNNNIYITGGQLIDGRANFANDSNSHSISTALNTSYALTFNDENPNDINGKTIVLWTPGGSYYLKAKYVQNNIVYYAFANYTYPDRYLQVSGTNITSGSICTIYEWYDEEDFHWYLKEAGNGYYYIVNKTGYCLSVYGYSGSVQNGLEIRVLTCNNSNIQKWLIK